MPDIRNFSKTQFENFNEDDLDVIYKIFDTISFVEPDDDGTFVCPIFEFTNQIVLPMVNTPIENDSYLHETYLTRELAATSSFVGFALKENINYQKLSKSDFIPVGIELVAVPFVMESDDINEDDNDMVFVQARRRVSLVDIKKKPGVFYGVVKLLEEPEEDEFLLKTYFKALVTQFKEYLSLNLDLSPELAKKLNGMESYSQMTDWIAMTLDLPKDDMISVLQELSVANRIQMVLDFYIRENNKLKIKEELDFKVNSEFDKHQKEAYLREQMRAIQSELGQDDPWRMEIAALQKQIRKTRMPKEAQLAAQKELHRLTMMTPVSPEAGIIRTYLEWLIELPWYKKSTDNLDVTNAQKILDSNHYGMKKAKDRILEFIAVKSLKPKNEKQPILCFVGPPGTGKTSMGRSIANALNREFVRISLGGVRDEAEIRGHRRTYIGAMPGRIIQTLKKSGKTNPVFMLDEIDKLASDHRGDPSSALLEVLDPEQNNTFSDNYLEVSYDLSQAMFITTANSQDTIPWALLDRMEIVEFTGYIEEDKIQIAKQFLIKRQFDNTGLSDQQIEFEDETLKHIIRFYTYEAGVRNFERMIGNVCRKYARKIAEGKEIESPVTPSMLFDLLGPPLYSETKIQEEDQIGVATALAWTYGGGDIMPVEVLLTAGKGTLQMTGSLGDVMQESMQAGLTYLKANAEKLELEYDDFDEIDIHVHVPEGAVPKDGPSAGVTVLTAMVSAFSERKVRRDVGMTGEITLLGNVLPIGGVREKVLAAYRAGLKTVLLPEKNKKDVLDIPKEALDKIEIKFVKTLEEIFNHALLEKEETDESEAVEEEKPDEEPSENVEDVTGDSAQ